MLPLSRGFVRRPCQLQDVALDGIWRAGSREHICVGAMNAFLSTAGAGFRARAFAPPTPAKVARLRLGPLADIGRGDVPLAQHAPQNVRLRGPLALRLRHLHSYSGGRVGVDSEPQLCDGGPDQL